MGNFVIYVFLVLYESDIDAPVSLAYVFGITRDGYFVNNTNIPFAVGLPMICRRKCSVIELGCDSGMPSLSSLLVEGSYDTSPALPSQAPHVSSIFVYSSPRLEQVAKHPTPQFTKLINDAIAELQSKNEIAT